MVKRKTRVKLSPVREAWAKQRGGAVFRGKALIPPTVTEAKFAATLERITDAMRLATEREVLRLYRTSEAELHGLAMDASFASMASRLLKKLAERFGALFTDRAGGLAEALAKGVSKSSAEQLGASLKEVSGGVTLKTDVVSGKVADIVAASIKENVALIKSIPSTYFEKIQGDVMRSIQTGRGMADLQPAIEATGEVTKKRAALIARDQTSKATTAINRARMQGLGVKKFEWVHSGGGKEPRPLHKNVLNGKIFDLNDPPVIDERTGEKGLPGQLINCRCRMAPVISFEAQEVTE